MTETDDKKPRENFIRDIVREDRAAGRIEGRVQTSKKAAVRDLGENVWR